MSRGADSPARGAREAVTLSALFDSVEEVDHTLRRLIRAGVPRDLVEVVVSADAARRFYPDRPRAPRGDALRYAGAGALIGLIVGAAISLVLVALPGFHEPGGLVIAQLLGPNFMTAAGVVVGALVGLLVRRRAERRHARAVESPDAIVVVVTARSDEETAALDRILRESGGREVRAEP
ncbi:MAG: hypothetical protein ACODAE_08000 [Gemmatimonadota bacterium]